DKRARLKFPGQFGDIEGSNRHLGVGLEIYKHPIHIRPVQV
ncbi:MAG: hypothetical protein RLZZ602_1350, partial [Pseudomonadota bacterium]